MRKPFLHRLLALSTLLAISFGLCISHIASATKITFAEDSAMITQANMVLKESLGMNYYAEVADSVIENGTTLAMNFTMNDTNGNPYTTTVNGIQETTTQKYVFTLNEIAPQLLAENIKAEFVLLNESTKATKLLDTYDGYSVKAYLLSLLPGASSTLKTLVYSILSYGAASQAYLGMSNTITNDLTIDAKFVSPVHSDNTTNEIYNDEDNPAKGTQIFGMGVWFDRVITPYLTVYVANGDLESLTVKTSKSILELKYYQDYADGALYRAEVFTLKPTEYSSSRNVTLTINNVKQRVSVCLNDYLYTIYNTKNNTQEEKDLAYTVYNYGVAATAYVG